ncbi:amidohydrolase family protein [Kaistia dalseonensis]|uniref:L-fuconolactonase n=1 Tax=Kaistia dalseonensis TaxID=410840 RepID=A0ABU0H5N6_9HYPH|nr:amidohydrolase family protein [Kaistia dalseonensis]MCX5494501.1 amidohydrolase family protein [Kaistia dalseonensis]MDQ0437080.1 L-fuconolactonase [Kaistia dalseonensis]
MSSPVIGSSPVIDAHHHFWDPASGGDYGWLSGPFAPINRTFEPDDLRPALLQNGIDGTVLVQTWNDLGETRDFIRTAAATDFVAGVVGWIDLTDPDVGETIAALQATPEGKWLVGVRHLIQTENDPNWLLRGDVKRGLRAGGAAGLAYDLVPNLPQLPSCVQIVAALPEQRFVLDHIAKPEIRNGGFDEWAALMRGFRAERGHVWCKLSGMVTEANWESWTPADLKPYVLEVLDIFGVERCMFGTDWPVCLVAASYTRVVDALRECLVDLSSDEQDQIFSRSAIEAYRLPDFYSAAP